jgi:diguanylate cyclase (GGDEF)-like protein/PAS domain S-box-containing protein
MSKGAAAEHPLMGAHSAPATLTDYGLRSLGTDAAWLVAILVVILLLAVLLLLNRALKSSNRQLAQAATYQSVTSNAAIGLARAFELDSLAQVTVQAAVGLAGSAYSWSVFMVLDSTGPTVVAAAGPAPSRFGEPANGDLAADWGGQSPAGSSALIPFDEPDGDRERPYSDRLVVPVMVGDEMRGKLVVGHFAGDVEAFIPALRQVCLQMGLALESAEAVDERLQRNERRFRSLVQNSSDAVTLLGPDGVALYQSDSGRAVLGREAEDLLGQTFVHLTHPDDAAYSRAQFIKVLTGGPGARVTYECRFLHADGRWRQLECIMTNLLGDPDVGAIVSNSRDITDRRALEQQLSHQAFHDSLTGLANRALFLDRVAHALDRADRGAEPVAVMFVDIDDFKVVNDSLGHHLGDGVLIAVAERLKAAIRPGDTVARLGGDEFALLLESGEMPEAAEVVACRIATDLVEPVRIGAEDISVRASIGIALGQSPVDEPDGLLRDADLAMYLAKRNGKGRFEMFHPGMHEEAVRRLETSAELRTGIEDRQLEVFYQPIIDIRTTDTIGAEALVRWHHPTRGLVSPAEFIPIAESTGLIVPLGKWVLTEACRQAESWRSSGITDERFHISVNLSARQLQDPAILDDVAAAIRKSGLPPAFVVLEVTESVIMDDLPTALSRLYALKDLGLRLAVDDFGTGYSSLSYLRNFPMDIVKIDKSFVDRITLDPEGAAMVRGVIDLSSALGLTTIAEGVENPDQLALLHELGCDSVQGYMFAKPMTGEEFADTFTKRRTEASELAQS